MNKNNQKQPNITEAVNGFQGLLEKFQPNANTWTTFLNIQGRLESNKWDEVLRAAFVQFAIVSKKGVYESSFFHPLIGIKPFSEAKKAVLDKLCSQSSIFYHSEPEIILKFGDGVALDLYFGSDGCSFRMWSLDPHDTEKIRKLLG